MIKRKYLKNLPYSLPERVFLAINSNIICYFNISYCKHCIPVLY